MPPWLRAPPDSAHEANYVTLKDALEKIYRRERSVLILMVWFRLSREAHSLLLRKKVCDPSLGRA